MEYTKMENLSPDELINLSEVTILGFKYERRSSLYEVVL